MTTHPNNTENQHRRIAREKAAGLIRVLVTIPAERKAELKEIVNAWREEACKQSS